MQFEIDMVEVSEPVDHIEDESRVEFGCKIGAQDGNEARFHAAWRRRSCIEDDELGRHELLD